MNKSRIGCVIENMSACGLDQILVTHAPSLYYLTGHYVAPGERMLALYLNTDGDLRLYANRLFALSDDELPIVEFGDTDDCVGILADGVKPGRLGIDKFWPSHFTIRLMERRRDVTPTVGSAPVDDARMLKDAEEIAIMREASRMNDRALAATIAEICEGMTEKALEAAYLKNAKAQGGTGPSFAPITCFGANGAEPHHDNDDTRLKDGDSVILDVGLLHRRYCSDMTRTQRVVAQRALQHPAAVIYLAKYQTSRYTTAFRQAVGNAILCLAQKHVASGCARCARQQPSVRR